MPENRRAIIGYLQRHGRPLAVYTDHAGHFGQWLTKKEERTDTIISRALGGLGVEVILAGSPHHPPPPRSGWPGVENTHPTGGHFYFALPPDISIPV